MDPTFMFEHLDPTNRFAMEGLNMVFAAKFRANREPLPKGLIVDIMTDIKHLHLGLALVVNISENVAIVKIYDNYVVDSLRLHATLSNLWDIEDQLY